MRRSSSLSRLIPLNSLGEKYAFLLIWQRIFRTWLLLYTILKPFVNCKSLVNSKKSQNKEKSICSINTSAYKNINLENKRLDSFIRIIRENKNKPDWFEQYDLSETELHFFSKSAPSMFQILFMNGKALSWTCSLVIPRLWFLRVPGLPFNIRGLKNYQIWDYWLLILPLPFTSHYLSIWMQFWEVL